MALTAHGTWKFPSNPPSAVKNAAPGYCYRCPYGLTYPSCDVRCARDVEPLIRCETSGEPACFIAEPIQGVGGTVTPPPEYFQIAYDIVRKHGGLCIADEVQTGFGRTGTKFWGFENWGVTPDLVTLAKGIGNGAPLGACVTRPEVAAVMKNRLHFNTFGGNPVSVTQGLATLEVIDGEHIQENALRVCGHLKDAGLQVVVQPDAGTAAGYADAAYRDQGARLADDALTSADVPLTVQPPTVEEAGRLKEGVTLIGFLQPYGNAAGIQALAARKVTAFAMELMPRITRAQPMDALSAMSTVSGYKAVLLAAARLPKFFPLLMTAAGTMTPARVFILGAGVAGLQAIGTARRLGAVVEAFDTRPAVKEQVESLGARFVALELEAKDAEAKTGYAQAQSEEFYRRQQEMMGRYVAA